MKLRYTANGPIIEILDQIDKSVPMQEGGISSCSFPPVCAVCECLIADQLRRSMCLYNRCPLDRFGLHQDMVNYDGRTKMQSFVEADPLRTIFR